MQSYLSCVLLIVASNKVVLLSEGIKKICPSGFSSKHFELLYDMLLTLSLPPIFDTGNNLKECKGDIFSIWKIVDGEITL